MAKQHKSIRGRLIQMDDIRNSHGSQRAIGNAGLNARGDVLDSKGNIIKYRHEIVQEYYNKNPNAVKHISLKDKINSIPVISGDEITKTLKDIKQKQDEEVKKSRKLIDKED